MSKNTKPFSPSNPPSIPKAIPYKPSPLRPNSGTAYKYKPYGQDNYLYHRYDTSSDESPVSESEKATGLVIMIVFLLAIPILLLILFIRKLRASREIENIKEARRATSNASLNAIASLPDYTLHNLNGYVDQQLVNYPILPVYQPSK